MRLLVDIGNTRVKWALLDGERLAAQRAAVHAGWSTEDWRRELFTGHEIERVLAVSVAGPAARAALEAAARASGVRTTEFVASTARCAGVRSAYPDPRLLGVDRWVATIGGYAHARGACCVVDVGTAATLDCVDATGQHLGGYIVPGPAMMIRSLHAGTSNLAAHTAASPADAGRGYADNTRDAIERGCRLALAALVDRTHADLVERVRGPVQLLCTGGAVDEVLPYVRVAAEHVPDLVLRGLARIAREPA